MYQKAFVVVKYVNLKQPKTDSSDAYFEQSLHILILFITIGDL